MIERIGSEGEEDSMARKSCGSLDFNLLFFFFEGEWREFLCRACRLMCIAAYASRQIRRRSHG